MEGNCGRAGAVGDKPLVTMPILRLVYHTLDIIFSMRQNSMFCVLIGLLGGAFLQAEENEEMVSNLILVDESLASVISLYEQITGLDIVAELEYSYRISFNSRGVMSKAQMGNAL